MESKLLSAMADQYQMDPKEFIAAVKGQCFAGGACSDAQLLMLLSVAKTYDLNPLIRELHAFVNKQGKMEIVVGVDGWFKIVARDKRVLGWEDAEERNDKGQLVAVTVWIYRSDRRLDNGKYLPGKYRAVMDEWLMEHKPGKDATNWEEMPEHRLYGVAFKECARRTLGITEVIGEMDEVKLARTERVVTPEVVIPPAPPVPAGIEYEERVPMPDFRDEREKVPVEARGHLRVKLDEAVTVTSNVEAPIAPTTATSPAVDHQSAAAGVNPPTPEVPESQPEVGGTAGSVSLEEFIKTHKVPTKRINLFLAKKGAGGIAELDAEAQAEFLGILTKSYGVEV